MKAVVFHGSGDIRLEDVPEPKIDLVRRGSLAPGRMPTWTKVELLPAAAQGDRR